MKVAVICVRHWLFGFESAMCSRARAIGYDSIGRDHGSVGGEHVACARYRRVRNEVSGPQGDGEGSEEVVVESAVLRGHSGAVVSRLPEGSVRAAGAHGPRDGRAGRARRADCAARREGEVADDDSGDRADDGDSVTVDRQQHPGVQEWSRVLRPAGLGAR